ncbi:hypothetical protein SFK671_1275, partial [Shigella flexneri K-671]
KPSAATEQDQQSDIKHRGFLAKNNKPAYFMLAAGRK